METLPSGRSVFGSLFDMLFPPVCPLCEKAIVKEDLCQGCLSGFNALKIASPLCTRCGVPFALSASKDHLCGRCCKKEPPYIQSRSVFGYDGAVLDAIHSLKYRHNVGIAPALGRLIALSGCVPDEKVDIVVPVPLHPSRLRKRGFNQSLLIARPIAGALRAKIDYTGLKKIKSTKDQIGLDEKERAENMKGAFAAALKAFDGKTVLLVDDVYTTGATIRACSSALVRAGARVYAITLARTGMV
ncbi:MAG: ComF family protein [Deltaproteobacteria bacterium]